MEITSPVEDRPIVTGYMEEDDHIIEEEKEENSSVNTSFLKKALHSLDNEDDLSAENENLIKENDRLTLLNQELESEVTSIRNNYSELLTMKSNLLSEVESLTEQNASLESHSAELEAQIKSNTSARATEKERTNQYEEEIALLRDQLELAQEKVNSLEASQNQLVLLEAENKELLNRLDNLENESEEAKKLGEKTSQLESEIFSVQRQNQDLKDELSSLKSLPKIVSPTARSDSPSLADELQELSNEPLSATSNNNDEDIDEDDINNDDFEMRSSKSMKSSDSSLSTISTISASNRYEMKHRFDSVDCYLDFLKSEVKALSKKITKDERYSLFLSGSMVDLSSFPDSGSLSRSSSRLSVSMNSNNSGLSRSPSILSSGTSPLSNTAVNNGASIEAYSEFTPKKSATATVPLSLSKSENNGELATSSSSPSSSPLLRNASMFSRRSSGTPLQKYATLSRAMSNSNSLSSLFALSKKEEGGENINEEVVENVAEEVASKTWNRRKSTGGLSDQLPIKTEITSTPVPPAEEAIIPYTPFTPTPAKGLRSRTNTTVVKSKSSTSSGDLISVQRNVNKSLMIINERVEDAIAEARKQPLTSIRGFGVIPILLCISVIVAFMLLLMEAKAKIRSVAYQ